MDIETALRCLRRLALATTPEDRDAARFEAIDVFDQAGWLNAARQVTEILGRKDDHV